MIQRAITGFFFVAILVAGILYSPLTFVLLFCLIAALSVQEFCRILNTSEKTAVVLPTALLMTTSVYLIIAQVLYLTLGTLYVFAPYFLLLMGLLIRELYLRHPDPIGNWAYGMLSQLYIALPFSLLMWLYVFFAQPELSTHYSILPDFFRNSAVYEASFLLPLSVFVFLWMSDTGAYCFGSWLGKHKLFERISPKKSWEGFFGGLFVAILSSIGMWYLDTLYLSAFSLPVWMGLALVVAVFGTWGDLVESLLKRKLDLKDSGSLLPGHGGMLDRFDSSLMAIPAALCYVFLVNLLP